MVGAVGIDLHIEAVSSVIRFFIHQRHDEQLSINNAHAGPCGQFTDSNGQFTETLTLCAPACKPSGTCTTAGQTIANQTWTVAAHALSSDVKSISYQCNKILVNGK
jgi:hypothetical protein